MVSSRLLRAPPCRAPRTIPAAEFPPVPHRDTADCSVTECVTVLQCSIVVLHSGVRQATPLPSLPCTRTIPADECPVAPRQDTAYCSVTECVAVLQCYIVVLQGGIKQATPRPSLPCTRTIPAAECPVAPRQDTADCSVTECVAVLQCYIVVLQGGIKQATPHPSLPCTCTIAAAECPPAPRRDTADCSVTECVTVLECYITVLQSWIKQATPCPSLPCARTIPATECHPAPLRDTADRSPADIALVTFSDLAEPSPADFAPSTLRNLAETYPEHGHSWQCLPGFTHRQLDLFTSNLFALAELLSAHGGSSLWLVQPLSQLALSDAGH